MRDYSSPPGRDSTRPYAPPASQFPAYPASWYLFGRSRDVRDRPVPRRMLGHDLVAYRVSDGRVAILDARCSHLGANLGYGRVCGDLIECPFHNWKYGPDGRCANIPSTPNIPAFARQRSFPVVERHGYVFFFLGSTPLFPLPFFEGDHPAEYCAGRVFRFVADCPWYVTTAHGFDLQHFEAVHDRRLLAPPQIDCPAPFARRNRYRAEVLGKTRLDGILKLGAGRTVDASITTWGGTFVVIAANFGRARSRFFIVTQPLEHGHTLCEGIVLGRRSGSAIARRVVDPLVLEVRRIFTHRYLEAERRVLRQTRYSPSSLIDADRAMADYFQWLADLPQNGARALDSSTTDTGHHETLSRPVSHRLFVGGRSGRRTGGAS